MRVFIPVMWILIVVLVSSTSHAQAAAPSSTGDARGGEAAAASDDDGNSASVSEQPPPAAKPVEAAAQPPAASTGSAAAPSTKAGSSSSVAPLAADNTRALSLPSSSSPACPAGKICLQGSKASVWPVVRVRAGFEQVQSDPQLFFVGKNDGFLLEQARLGLAGALPHGFGFRFVLDAASFTTTNTNTNVSRAFVGAARDMYISYQPHPFFEAYLGQMFMPVDAEGSTTIATLNFARRSVAVSGVRAGHGIVVSGLSPTRQLGAMIGSSDDAAIGSFRLSYRLAVSNGNGQNVFGNDNKLPAAYGRIGFGYDDVVHVSVGGSWNARTVGGAPNLFNEADISGFADARIRLWGIEWLGQGIARQTRYETLVPDTSDARGNDTAVGLTTWLVLSDPFGLPMWGLKPGVRFSYYDPTSAFPDDQLLEYTAALRWDAPFDVPCFLVADYTILQEGGPGVRDLDNNRFTLLAEFDL